MLEVLDRGCGISKDQMPHIFEPYWRASEKRREGLGLGLAIAKGIVEAHDDRIWVESAERGKQVRFLATGSRIGLEALASRPRRARARRSSASAIRLS